MENNLTNAILDAKTASTEPLSLESSNSTGFFSQINIITWLLILLILVFLGFTVYIYLAKGTQGVSHFFEPILQKITGNSHVATATGTSSSKPNDVEPEIRDTIAKSSIKPHSVQDTQDTDDHDNGLKQILKNHSSDDYEAHQASSSITTDKAGWCYIGEDRGPRSCMKVGADDKCMSGDIFPSQDLCVNPNLRG